VNQNSGIIFSPFVDQSSPHEISMYSGDHSLQCCFPIDDILLLSGSTAKYLNTEIHLD